MTLNFSRGASMIIAQYYQVGSGLLHWQPFSPCPLLIPQSLPVDQLLSDSSWQTSPTLPRSAIKARPLKALKILFNTVLTNFCLPLVAQSIFPPGSLLHMGLLAHEELSAVAHHILCPRP